MLIPLRRLPGLLLRRSLSTAASRPSWAFIYRISTADESARGASLSLAPPPLASRVSIPRQAFGLDPLPADIDGRDPVNFFSYAPLSPKQGSDDLDSPITDGSESFINVFGNAVLAASGDGLLLFGTYGYRASAYSMSVHQRPSPGLLLLGEMARLPDLDGAENTYSAAMGLLTQADDGPPKRYVAAQLSVLDGGRRFLLCRLSSDTGVWDELALPFPLPPGRRRPRAL